MRLAACLALLALVPAAASAQEQIFRNAEVQSGKTLRLGAFHNVGSDCASAAAPEVKVVTPPKNGSLSVRGGKTKAGALGRCPKLEVPAQGVFYQPNAKYTGADEVVYEVAHAGGKRQVYTVKLTVSDKPAKAGGGDGLNL